MVNQKERGNALATAPNLLGYVAKSKLFWSLLIVRVGLSVSASSHTLSDLFIPFVNYFVESGFSDPWRHFAALGRTDSFPYPPLMLYLLAVPRLLFAPFLPPGTFTVTPFHLLALRLPLLVADFAICLVLFSWFPTQRRKIEWLYWGSPIVIYISYWYGQLDVIPTALFVLCLVALRKKRFSIGFVLYGLALGTKMHLLIALPFLAVLLCRQRNWKGSLKALGCGAMTYSALLIPFVFRTEFQQLVFQTPERLRALSLTIQLGPNTTIFVALLVLAMLWIRFYGFAKHNWDLFMLYMGLVFCTFISLSPPAPGYFIWSIPFVVYFLARTNDVEPGLFLLFNGLYLLLMALDPLPAGRFSSVVFTLMQAANAGIVYQMYVFGIKSNSIYRGLSRVTLIGAAGDSGAGKDYVTSLFQAALGTEETVRASGDNYHRWPRGDAMWSVHTHLDARANNLHKQFDHVVTLARGKAVLTGVYDHGSGTFQQNVKLKSGRYLFLTGLHALALESQRDLLDLKIFVDPDEALRQYWKIRRDSTERGHTVVQVKRAMERRKSDRVKFIVPQREYADLIVQQKYGKKVLRSAPLDSKYMSLDILSRNSFNWMTLNESLQTCPTLSAVHLPFADFYWQKLTLSGQITAREIEAIAWQIIPNLDELTSDPSFENDLNGCLQLVFLCCLSDRLRWGGRSSDGTHQFPAPNWRAA